jgi:hypothetical protein
VGSGYEFKAGYTENTLRDALHDMQTNGISARKASILYKIPRTLINKLYGNHSNNGQTDSSENEEKSIASSILHTSCRMGSTCRSYITIDSDNENDSNNEHEPDVCETVINMLLLFTNGGTCLFDIVHSAL